MRTAFQDYYRCPDGIGEPRIFGELSSAESYFIFDETICYGRHSDVSHDMSPTGDVCLPFDFTEIVRNLREERYLQTQSSAAKRALAGISRSAYYLLRPMLSVSVRKQLQKLRLRGWKEIQFPRWPVDITVETLMKKTMALEIKSHEKIPFIWFWPDGARACVMLTHDVESQVGLDFCGTLMDIDDDYGIKASFQIVPEKRYSSALAVCSTIRGRGFEVNVHDLNHDGRLFENRSSFQRRAARINDYARRFESRGFRAGAMYRNQQWLCDLDFSYDMSVPNVAHLEPQRGGCCTVMPYFVGNVLELPLTTVQDYSLFHILGDYSISLWREQIDRIVAQNGLVALLTHPDYLIERRARAVYCQLLAHVQQLSKERGLWRALPGQVDRWWRSRHQMVIVRDGNGWRIEGPDSERARLAYATLENGQFLYELEGARLCKL